MSKTLKIYSELLAICEKAGLDPNAVEAVTITSDSVMFSVLEVPFRAGSGGNPIGSYVIHPWTREP